VDLLQQLLSHYCIAWAVNDAAQLGKKVLTYLFVGWGIPFLTVA